MDLIRTHVRRTSTVAMRRARAARLALALVALAAVISRVVVVVADDDDARELRRSRRRSCGEASADVVVVDVHVMRDRRIIAARRWSGARENIFQH